MDDKWEYQTLVFNAIDGNMDKRLNKEGQQGWEAVGFSSTSHALGVTMRIYVLLKRLHAPKPESDNEAGLKLKKLMQERIDRKEDQA
jgi:hypothetical protein